MFATEGQHLIFAGFLAAGLIAGLIYELFYFLRAAFKFNKIVSVIADIIFALCAGIMMIITARALANGEIRLYSVISFILGYFFEHIALHKHFANLYARVYNHLTVLFKKIKSSKAIKKIFK